MAHHNLKTLSTYFEAALAGDKPFEIRDNSDRGFQKGDTVTLIECENRVNQMLGCPLPEPTGRTITGLITYVTNFEQKPGWVVFGWCFTEGKPHADK